VQQGNLTSGTSFLLFSYNFIFVSIILLCL
jgi:hypothetical protein